MELSLSQSNIFPLSKFFPVSQQNIFPVSQIFPLSGKSKNQISRFPYFPCAVATLTKDNFTQIFRKNQHVETVKSEVINAGQETELLNGAVASLH